MDNDRFDEVLRGHLNSGGSTPIDPDAPLKDLGLTSMEAVELLFDLEDEFGVELPDEAMTDETFSTRRSLFSKLEQVHATKSAQS
ncbi:phosphopantetheine-binding protein [Arthrobacter sp. E44]|uniref:phosphopantetheine-binding protein n=1 Tax=Arthrobacter sp. E44 TaxID=3341794 RepID=UPI0035A6F25E